MKRSRYALAALFGFLPAALGVGPLDPLQCRPSHAGPPPAVCPLERADENPLAMVHPADLPEAEMAEEAQLVHPADLPTDSSAAIVRAVVRDGVERAAAACLPSSGAAPVQGQRPDGCDDFDGCESWADEFGCFPYALGGCGDYPRAANPALGRGVVTEAADAAVDEEPIMAPPASLPRDRAADVVGAEDCGCFDTADEPAVPASQPQASTAGCNEDQWYWYEYEYEYGTDCFGRLPAADNWQHPQRSLADVAAQGGYDAGQRLALEINEENDGLPILPAPVAPKHPADLSVGYGYMGDPQVWYDLARAAGLHLPNLEELQAAARRAAERVEMKASVAVPPPPARAVMPGASSRLKRGMVRLGAAVQRLGDALGDTLASLGEVVATAVEVSAQRHPADLPAEAYPSAAARCGDEHPGLCRRPARSEYERTDMGR